MTRSLAIVFAAFVAVAAAFVVARGRSHGAAAPEPHPTVVVSAPVVQPPVAVSPPLEASAEEGAGGGPAAPAPDGAAPLSSGAPRQVVFGVALVWYRGAESAPANARTKDEARALAASIAEDAKKDFAGAVKRADVGFEDAGSIQRTVLEPQAEAVLFSLEVGEVGGPVEAPRGFYVFRRIE